MLQTPAMMAASTPGYKIDLDPETFLFVATSTTNGSTFSGTLNRCLEAIAAEQGWSAEDLAETIAYNAGA